MTTATKTPAEPISPAVKALHTAERATAAAESALAPARDNLEAAQQAVTDANAEAFAALTTKHPDATAARERVQKARAAVKQADDDAEWAQLQLQAAEAVHETCHADEQRAHRAVFIEEYLAEAELCSSGTPEESQLAQLKNTITELTIALCERDALHSRLGSQWQSLPPDERPTLRCAPFMPGSLTLRGEFIDDLHPLIAAALKAATGDAAGTLRRRG